ncbi:Integrin beta-1 [Halocaridina rubra]|uniref:Integrin beta n=1 Tax=Halocaridina rubra TaxID=373956 RepID=A0AAN8XE48_HALRR
MRSMRKPEVRWKLLLAILLTAVGGACAQNDCSFQTKCNECIQTPGCMWCASLKNAQDNTASHCISTQTSNVQSICEPGSLENPSNNQSITEDRPLSRSDNLQSAHETIVQLKPQKIKLQLRKGTTEKIALTYRQAVGYPIDLYYLMDLSYSMKDDQEQLAQLGSRLTSTLKNLTTFYTIGFGSFVDKVIMPFVDMHPSKIDTPCAGCAKPYSFRNDLPLGPNGDLFSQKVREAQISGNLDSPEGGFDALMQVLVCKDEIKWRDQARRIIVFSTDAKFHQAGDGKLAGVVVPNDEKCHMNALGEYDAYASYDYPSIGQINKISKEKDIYIIFAVAENDNLYSDLSKVVENSSYGKLTSDSSNVVDLVKDQYNKITSIISLTDNSSDAISIRYSSNCKNPNAEPVTTNQCLNMREGDEVTFHLDVELNNCPAYKRGEVVEVKTLQDSLILEIEFNCNCDCEKQDDGNLPATNCSNVGAVVCGICKCFDGYRGEQCQCKTDGSGEELSDEEKCKANTNDTEVCSGNGACVCGVCSCYNNWSGKFCHCNRRQCLSEEGELCSGKGNCACDQCACNIGYEGRACECQTSDACRKPGDLEICSGNGDCKCGQCVCNSTQEVRYSGQYCDDCLTCSVSKCSEFYAGVLCRFHNPTSSNCNLTVIVVDNLEDYQEANSRLCSFVDEEDGCQIMFIYRYVEELKTYEIHVQREKVCPLPAPIMTIVFGILAGIVAIGLLTLLLWKLFTTIHDRREYARFENERSKAAWTAEGNPLYKDPTNTFRNPAFSATSEPLKQQEAK